MAKNPLWQSVQNNPLLRPFQVQDIGGRTLLQRSRWFFILILVAMVLLLAFSSAQVNLLINRDELERSESEFVSQFYPTYDELYYWLSFQGNLAVQLAPMLNRVDAGERFLSEIEENLGKIDNLKYIQFGQVGVSSQWRGTRSADGEWALTTEIDQDFAAWLLTQDVSAGEIYWYAGRSGSDHEICLFWLDIGEDGEKIYFLAAADFPYELTVQQIPRQRGGAIAFLNSNRGQQVYPLLPLSRQQNASETAQLASERLAPARININLADGAMAGQIMQKLRDERLAIFNMEINGETFWVKIVPVNTKTDYNLLAIILPEAEPLTSIGIRSSWVRWSLWGVIGLNVVLFLYYYWWYSRRFYFTNQIKDLLKSGESARLEFKSTLRFDLQKQELNKSLENTVLKSIAAFNNTDGGLLIIGVSDDAQVVGLAHDYKTLKKPDKDGFELHLRALISKAYGQHFAARRVEIFFPVLDNKEVCVVKVKKGRSALYTDATDKNGNKLEKFYIRMGNSSREVEKLSDIIDYQNQRFGWHWPKWGKK